MKKPKKPPTPEQIEDSRRLRHLFEQRAGMPQLAFGETFGIGNQGMVWQYLNVDHPSGKGSALNVAAAIKFAEGLGCHVGDFSPSLQDEIDRISRFSSMAREQNMTSHNDKKNNESTLISALTPPGKPVVASIEVHELPETLKPDNTTHQNDWLAAQIARASPKSHAAIQAIILSSADRALLKESDNSDARTAVSAVEILEEHAIAAIVVWNGNAP